MVTRPVVLLAAILMTASLSIPFISSEDPFADSTSHVIFYDGDGNVLSEGDWNYRDIPYCIKVPSAPAGMHFIGWSTEEGSTVPETILPVESDIGYHPVFASADSVHSVEFDPDNGSDVPRVVYCLKGSEYTVPALEEMGFSVKYDRGPFILDGWCSESGNVLSPGDSFVPSSDISLKASWIRSVPVSPVFEKDLEPTLEIERFSDAVLSVTCDDTEGDGLSYEWFLKGGSEASSVATGPQMPLPDTMTSHPGVYTVYVDVTNLDRSAVTKEVTVRSTECVITVEPTYILTVSGTDIVQNLSEGDVVPVPKPAMDGHTLTDISMPNGVSVFDDDTITMPAHDVILIPTWVSDMYDVRFVSEGTSVWQGQYGHGEVITMIAAPLREGYAFQGWYLGNVPYSVGSNLTVTTDVDLVAVWSPETPSCTVDGDERTGVTTVLGSEGVLYWYDSDGVRYLPGETVNVDDGQIYTPVLL